jgi:hypothetical protein
MINAHAVGTLVTKVTIIEDNSVSSAAMASPGGLTAGGITLVTLVVLASLLIFTFVLVWRRHVIRRNRRLDDMKSIRTSWSQPTRDGNGSYLTADFNDLALRHTKLNVHKCKSGFCEVCRPNLGVVQMLQVPRESESMRFCGLVRNSTMDSRVSSLGDPDEADEASFGPQPGRFEDPLVLEPIDDCFHGGGDTPDVVISVEEVEADDGEVSYVRSAHAKRSDTNKAHLAKNQVLL